MPYLKVGGSLSRFGLEDFNYRAAGYRLLGYSLTATSTGETKPEKIIIFIISGDSATDLSVFWGVGWDGDGGWVGAQ